MAEHRRGESVNSLSFISPAYRPVFAHEVKDILGKKEARRAELLDVLVQRGTEESYDAYSILELVHAGLSAAITRDYRQDGERILSGIEHYLQGSDIITKYALPPMREETEPGHFIESADTSRHESAKQLYGEMQRLLTTYQKRSQQRPDRFEFAGSETFSFLNQVAVMAGSTADKAETMIITHTTAQVRAASIQLKMAEEASDGDPSRLLDRLDVPGYGLGRPSPLRLPEVQKASLEREVRALDETLDRRQNMINLGYGLDSAEEALLLPEQLLEAAFADRSRMGSFDITRTKFGGVSLEDIFKPQPQNERTLQVMRYITNLPRGDLFWRMMMQRLFFMSQIASANASFKHPDWTEAVYMTQLDMADKLLTPGIDRGRGMEVVRDEAFAQEAGKMMAHLDEDTFWFYVHALYNGAKLTPFAYQQLHPEVSVHDFSQNVPLYKAATLAYASANLPADRETQIVLVDEALHWCIGAYREELADSWRPILDDKKYKQYRQILAEIISQPYETLHTRHFMEVLERRLGKQFLERLNGIALAELEDVQAQMIQAFTDRQMMGFWPRGDETHQVTFTGNKLPSMIGLESITFVTPQVDESYGEEIQFMIELSDPRTSIRGEVPVNFLEGSDRMKLTVDLSENPGLQSILRTVVVATFHDLVLRNRLLKMKTAGKAGEPERRGGRKRHGAGTTAIPGERAQKLPRQGHSVLDEPYIELEELHGQIDREISQRDTGYHPVTVDPHAMALRGADRYQYAVQRYQRLLKQQEAAGEREAELASVREEVERARSDMYNMSEGKREMLDSLPHSFRDSLHTIVDPLSQPPEVVYLDTWVSEYKRPKPTEEMLRSPRQMHERYYTTGPQSRFLDLFTVWLWGENPS